MALKGVAAEIAWLNFAASASAPVGQNGARISRAFVHASSRESEISHPRPFLARRAGGRSLG